MRRKIIDCIKCDNLLVEFLLDHKGKENVVSAKEISRFLTNKGFALKQQSVHTAISNLIAERHLPICSLNCKGYYWAQKKEDIVECIAHLKSRIDSLEDHIKHLRNFIME